MAKSTLSTSIDLYVVLSVLCVIIFLVRFVVLIFSLCAYVTFIKLQCTFATHSHHPNGTSVGVTNCLSFLVKENLVRQMLSS